MSRTPPAPSLAVSLGDPAGVGPELIAAAWASRTAAHLPPFFAVGGARLLAAAARSRGIDMPVVVIDSPADATAVFPRALPVLGAADIDWRPGQPDLAGAEVALDSLSLAAGLAVSGDACGLVTAPISKARLAEAGFDHPGQTEFVAEACGMEPGDAVMMLAGPSLRTVPLTIHMALCEVPQRLTTDLIVRRGRTTASALIRDFGFARPRLAFAGLNPHAGEDGRMGDEEARIITPALATLRSEGYDARGPFPADALFAPRARADYDVALCMYHDQALIPIKALDFDEGVNVTLGLPVVRTSPDHGTAFGIAGRNQAHPGATIAAIRLAGEMAGRRARS